MIKVLVIFSLCLTMASAQQLIQAPRPAPPRQHDSRTIKVTDYALLAGIAGARAADRVATSEAMRKGFHEGELPTFVAKSKPGLAAVEVGSFALETYISKRLSRRHPKWAILGDAISFAILVQTDIHSYRELGEPMAGQQPADDAASECPSTYNPLCGISQHVSGASAAKRPKVWLGE